MAGPHQVEGRSLRLLRHAKSSWADPVLEDHDRPLSERGVRAARLIGHYLGARRTSVQVVLCSSAVRARQTLDHILGSIGSPEVRIEPGIYYADSSALGHRLRQLEDDVDSVLVVGHNPSMQILADFLVGDGDSEAVERLREKFPTAGLAELAVPVAWGDLSQGCSYLQSFVIPRGLERGVASDG